MKDFNSTSTYMAEDGNIFILSKEKFLERFNKCVKPIEEMRKDLENGKF